MKSRKILLLLFIVQLLLCFSFAVSASDYDLAFTMDGSPSIVRSGDTLTVTVSVSENNSFLAAITEITYDSDALIYEGASSNDGVFDNVTVNNPSVGTVKVTIGNIMDAMFNANAEVYSATGEVVTLTFKVADGYEGDTALSLAVTSGDVVDPEKTLAYAVSGSSATVTVIDKNAHIHTEEIVPGKAATCTETGLTDGKRCIVCGEITVAQAVIGMLDHTEEIIPDEAATCTETGLTEGKKCSVCGEILVQQELIKALGHTEEVVPGKAATCTEAGLTEGKKCSVCGEILTAQETISALNHTYDNACDADCNTCGTVRTPSNHVYDNACDADCNVCGETRTPGEHVWGDWTVTKEATKNADGEQARECSECGEKETAVIPQLESNNTVVIIIVIAAVVLIAGGVAALLIIKKKKA